MSDELTRRPAASDCSEYQIGLINRVPDGNILEQLTTQLSDLQEFVDSIPESESTVVHAPYGWSVRQVIEHSLDADRVFGYRILRFAAGDQTDLPGWEENTYAACGYGPGASLSALGQEFTAIRAANIALLNRLTQDAWDHDGTADGHPITVRVLAWLMAGHWMHHHQILLKRLGRE
jgi:DinB superfamily